MSDLSHLIQYRCINREHLAQKSKERVFVYQSGWAFCRAGKHAPDHKFMATGGLARRHIETRQGTTR